MAEQSQARRPEGVLRTLRYRSRHLGGRLATIVLLTISIATAFDQERRKRERLAIVVAAYCSIIVSFAGVYYAMASNADLHDGEDAQFVFVDQAYDTMIHRAEKEAGLPEGQHVRRQPRNLRAFSGLPKLYYSGEDGVRPVNLVTRLTVMADCLHYSIVTISTTGFGDIVPRVWYATFATDVEILMGIALLVLALNASR
jgi:hypothetical protein